MKHLILLSLFTLNSSLFTLSAAVPLKWTVETSRAVPAQFEAYQGETLALEAALQSYGKPLEAPSNYSFYWQTNGMGNAWWSQEVVGFSGSGTIEESNSTVPLQTTTTTNVLFATWSPTNDVGAKVYNCFIGQPGTIYHAAFQLRLRPSPGATPNELPLPQKVIDFSQVTVLNPPWSGGGGGGGVDTNAVIGIIHKTVDGSARYTPKYLWVYDAADSYTDAAAEYYRSRGNGKVDGGCSSVRDGGFLYRNFDYPFDDRAEFVVRTVAAPATGAGTTRRFASVGVAQVGTNLTEAIVTSGKPSRCYKWLPGATVDGINENGVACNINVVGGEPQWDGGVSPALHPLAAIRWILDHATNAQHGAEYIASHIAFPQGWTQNFHYMISDERETWIVENGRARLDEAAVPVLTNFRLYPTRDTTGEGQERYDALASGANITNAWYTNAYRRETNPPWFSEFDNNYEYMNAAINAWNNGNGKESHRGETYTQTTYPFKTYSWWQTVHTSVYDISNRVLRVAVQEVDDWYVFQVPPSGATVDLAPIEAQIAALQDGKRDLTNDCVYVESFSAWSYTSDDPDLLSAYLAKGEDPVPLTESSWLIPSLDGEWHFTEGYAYGPRDALRLELEYFHGTPPPPGDKTATVIATRTKSVVQDLAYKLAKRTANPTSGSLAKFDSDGNLVAAAAGTDYLKDHQDISGKRDLTDNTCHKTEFTEWEFGGVDYDPSSTYSISFRDDGYGWNLFLNGSILGNSNPGVYGRDATFIPEFLNGPVTVKITATRSAVCTTGELYTTQGYVDGKVSSAVSTNNPAFVSAVRNTPAPEPGQGEYPPWGEYGTLGAAIAALVAGLAWAKTKLGEIFDNVGNIQDDFATDLLGKPVAIQKVQDIIADDVVPVTGDTSLTKTIATIGGKAIKAPDGGGGGGSQGYAFVDLTPTTESGYKVFTAQDHAINRFTLADATPVKVILPNATDANGRDFILKVNVTSATMPTFEIVKPSDAASVGIEAADDGWADLEAGINYFTITETDRA